MSGLDDTTLTDEEREEQERRRKDGRPTLDEEIVRRYEPDRLQKIVVRGAGRGEGLELSMRSEMERILPGYDFSKVRVFRGPLAEEVTARHKADAVTIANTGMILMRESARSAPGSTSGRALLAHELTHVAQAQRGMVFAKEHSAAGGGGRHEDEAEHTEREAGHGHGDHDSGTQSHDKGSEARKQDARRKVIMERVFDLMREENRFYGMRRGEH